MKIINRIVAITFIAVLLLNSMGTIAFAVEYDKMLEQAQVIQSSNGDGFTPFDLKWEDGAKGITISFSVQQSDIHDSAVYETYGNCQYKIVIFRDGLDIAETGHGGHVDKLRVKTDLTESFGEKNIINNQGEYIFVVFAFNAANDELLGEMAKSEPYIVGDKSSMPTQETPIEDSLQLEVDLRSETQAVFTITNPDFSQATQNTTRRWILTFGDYRFSVSSALLSGESPNSTNTEIYGNDNFYYNFDVKDNQVTISIQRAAVYDGYEPMPPDYDLRNVTAFNVEQVQTDVDGNYANPEISTFSASDVSDTRNWGQTFNIYHKWPLSQFIQGTMRQEQYERLYFTPPTNNYIIAETHIDSADFYARSASVANAQQPGKSFSTDATVLAWFDENDRLLGIVQRFNVPSSESGHAMMDAWFFISHFHAGTTAYFKGDNSKYGWYYRPIVTDSTDYGPENKYAAWNDLDMNIIYADDFSAFISGPVYKKDYISALESGHHDLLVPFTIIENKN